MTWQYVVFRWNDSDDQFERAIALAERYGIQIHFDFAQRGAGRAVVPTNTASDALSETVYRSSRRTSSGRVVAEPAVAAPSALQRRRAGSGLAPVRSRPRNRQTSNAEAAPKSAWVFWSSGDLTIA